MDLERQKQLAKEFRDECYSYACIFDEEYRTFAVNLAKERGLEYEVAASMAGIVLIRLGGEIMAASLSLDRKTLPEFLGPWLVKSTDMLLDESRAQRERGKESLADE